MATLEAERADWEKRYADAAREGDAANLKLADARKLALIERIHLCQRLLTQPLSGADDFGSHSEQQIEEMANRLERQIVGSLN